MTERRVNVRGIIYDNGALFAQRLYKKDRTTYDWWCILGGGLNLRETLTDGLHRVMIEETGVAPVIGKLLFVQQYYNADREREELEFFFLITNARDYYHIDLSKTSHGELEVADYGFVDPTKVTLLPEFLQTIDLADYVVNDRPVYTYNELG